MGPVSRTRSSSERTAAGRAGIRIRYPQKGMPYRTGASRHCSPIASAWIGRDRVRIAVGLAPGSATADESPAATATGSLARERRLSARLSARAPQAREQRAVARHVRVVPVGVRLVLERGHALAVIRRGEALVVADHVAQQDSVAAAQPAVWQLRAEKSQQKAG